MKPFSDSQSRTFRRLVLLLASLTSLNSATGADLSSSAVSNTAPDLVLILVDSLRADHLGCYGYAKNTSPAIDTFAATGTRFSRTIASGPWTQPSIMSLFTSTSPDHHMRVHWGQSHSTNVTTLAQALHRAGYQTFGITANTMTDRRYGFARGFDNYDDYTVSLSPDTTNERDAAAQAATGATITRLARERLLRRDPSRPLFLFVLYMDVHWDYLPPVPYSRMFTDDPVPPIRNIWSLAGKSVPEDARSRVVAAYDGEVRYTDTCISNLLNDISASPRAANTMVAICADHGESFWERGCVSHGNNFFDEEIRVPLILRPAASAVAPDSKASVVSNQVGLIDLAPTFLDYAGVPPPKSWQGLSLRPFLSGGTIPDRPVVLDNRVGPFMRGVRTSKFLIVGTYPFTEPSEVYDLAADPAEKNNLALPGKPLPNGVADLVPLLKPFEHPPLPPLRK